MVPRSAFVNVFQHWGAVPNTRALQNHVRDWLYGSQWHIGEATYENRKNLKKAVHELTREIWFADPQKAVEFKLTFL